TVEELVQFMDEKPEYGIVSPIHLNGKGNELDARFEGYMKKEFSKTFLSDYADNKLRRFYDVPFVNAAAWMISRRCLERVGIFHPMFFHYGEDNNYISRVSDYLFKVAVMATTKIRHDRENLKSNPFRDNSKVIFKCKTTINVLNKREARIKRFVLVIIDLITIVSKVPAKGRFAFLKHGIKDWVSIAQSARKFDERELDIKIFNPK
ncbi:MAG: hypothetical protein OXH57_00705, partial [Ekhidna sp.]|nr:hypothetical protein [Ekhidna sp.]